MCIVELDECGIKSAENRRVDGIDGGVAPFDVLHLAFGRCPFE